MTWPFSPPATRTLLAVLSTVAAACSEPTEDPDASSARPTYHQDVAPLLAASCNGCHKEGGVAPMSFTTAEGAAQWADAMVAATRARLMPPWLPGGTTPPMHDDPRLSQAQLDLLAAWAAAGAPAGDAANAAPLSAPRAVDIGTPETRVDTGVDYVPDAGLRDDYRCFLVDPGLTTSRMVTGYRVTPGNASSVHHVIITHHPPGARSELEALDAQDARPGWQCFGSTVPDDMAIQGLLGAWAPGTSAVKQPPGTGVPLAAGELLVVQMHYNTRAAGAQDPDRTTLELAYAAPGTESALRASRTFPLRPAELRIPAGAANHVVTGTQPLPAGPFGIPLSVQVVGLTGHMHLLGTSFLLTRTRGGQVTPLLDIPRWDFHWQNGFQLVTPVELRTGDTLTITCVYDNTPARRAAGNFTRPMSDVTWGEGTEDEMCLAFLQVTGL